MTAVTAFLAKPVLGTTVGKVLSTTAIAGGTLLNVAGTLRAGEETKAQSDFEAELAKAQAVQEQARALEEERLRRRQGEKLEARQRVQFARAGVRVGEGSPLLVLAETALDTEQDIDFIRQGGAARSSAFTARATTFRGIGRQARSSSRIKAGQTLLSGLSDLTRSNP